MKTYTVHVVAGLESKYFCGLSEEQADRMIKKYKAWGWVASKELENNESVEKSVLNHGKG